MKSKKTLYMKEKLFSIFILVTLVIANINAQNVGIGNSSFTADASAGLEIKFTDKGLLIPRIALTSTNNASPITSPATSLLVYNTATAGDVTPGYYYWTGSKWMRLLAADDKIGWLLTGNSGTTPTTNFLGTTDAQDMVIRTNNTERARIVSNGQVLINRTTAIRSGDLLEAQGNATYPFAINGFTDQASGIGVYGYNSASGGTAIFGLTSTGYGVAGSATGGAGVYAEDSSAAGTGEAIYAKNFHATGNGVLAAGNNINPTYIAGGVGGAFASTNVGLFGYGNNTPQSWGILGRSAAADGTGIVADISATAGTGTGCGVLAYSNQDNGQGVQAQNLRAAGDAIWAVNTATAGTNTGSGIYAQTNQSNGFGVWGVNMNTNGTGIIGVGNNQTGAYLTNGSGGAFAGSKIGAYGKAIGTLSTGVVGAGSNQTANILTKGSGGAFTGDSIGVYGYAANSGNYTWGGFFQNSGTAYAYVGGKIGGTDYKINGTGTVSTIVRNVAGDRVNLYCPEAPEIYFQDFGEGQLINGKAHITLDPNFSKNIAVDDKHPLHVYIQLYDNENCKGVIVKNRTKDGFDVIELNGGNSNTNFSWFVTANRADEVDENGNVVSKYQDVRFAPAPGPLETVDAKEVKTTDKEIIKNIKDNKGIKEIESSNKNININKTN